MKKQKTAYYDVLNDGIYNCKPHTFIWFHEKGHQNQFTYPLVRYLDKKLYMNKILYFFWNQLLELDANIYAIVKYLKFKFHK